MDHVDCNSSVGRALDCRAGGRGSRSLDDHVICTFVLTSCIPNVETSGLKSLER